MYLITHYWPNGKREQYENTVAEIVQQNNGQRPEGEISHAAGPTQGTGQQGWLVTSVFESKDAWEQFKNRTLLPTIDRLQNQSFQGKPQEHTAEVLAHVPASSLASTMGAGTSQQQQQQY